MGLNFSFFRKNETIEERHARLNDGKFRKTAYGKRLRPIDSAVIIGIVVLITILLLFFFILFFQQG
ncbi:MAG: hypothetical protein WCX48_07475 [Bacteroidales bacterium]